MTAAAPPGARCRLHPFRRDTQVWARLCAGLAGLPVATPVPSALTAARGRVGIAPLRAMFDLLRSPETGCARRSGRTGVFWRERLVTAVDGTILCCPDTPANLTQFHKGGSSRGTTTGYPMVRVLALVACGTPHDHRRGVRQRPDR